MFLFRKINVRLIYVLIPVFLLLLFIVLRVTASGSEAYIQRSKILVEFQHFILYKKPENRWPLHEDYENYLIENRVGRIFAYFILHETVIEGPDISEGFIKYTFHFRRIPKRTSTVTIDVRREGIPDINVDY